MSLTQLYLSNVEKPFLVEQLKELTSEFCSCHDTFVLRFPSWVWHVRCFRHLSEADNECVTKGMADSVWYPQGKPFSSSVEGTSERSWRPNNCAVVNELLPPSSAFVLCSPHWVNYCHTQRLHLSISLLSSSTSLPMPVIQACLLATGAALLFACTVSNYVILVVQFPNALYSYWLS